jgi:hypothetical protein
MPGCSQRCPDGRHRDGRKAVEAATKACELEQWLCPFELGTLAAAYAEAGDFASAVNWQSQANKLHDSTEGRAIGEARLKLYQEKKPCRAAQASHSTDSASQP